MLAVGLGLGLKALLSPLRDHRFVVAALGLNFILAPALAWVLVLLAAIVIFVMFRTSARWVYYEHEPEKA